MTTIAWDGRNLAGDKLRSLNGHTTLCTKVFAITCKHNGRPALVGFAGDSCDCVRARMWLEDMDGAKPALTSLAGLLVVPKKKGTDLYYMDEKLVFVPLAEGPFAIGSGGSYALGALHSGKNAGQSVMIASRLDISTGLGYDVVRL